MSKTKLAWKDMTEEERAIFGCRAKGPILAVLACTVAVASSLGMLYVLQQFWA